MRKFAKPILIAGGAAAGLVVLVVLAANLYLQSKDVQERLRLAASQAAGVPVQIRGTAYTPWDGLRVTGVVVPHGGETRVPFLDVAAVSVRFEWLSLFQRQFLVREVVVKNPVLNILQADSGEWKKPPRFPEPDAAVIPTSEPPVAEGPLVVTVPAEESTPRPDSARPRVALTRPVALEQVKVRDGDIYLEDAKRVRIGSVHGVDVDGARQPDDSWKGTFVIAEAQFFGRIYPRKIRGQFTWDGRDLEVSGIEAKWAEGLVTGHFSLQTGTERRFSGVLKVLDVALRKLVAEAGLTEEGTRGKLFGDLQIEGTPGRPESVAGRGRVELRSARFEPASFVRQLGELLSIEELQMLQLRTAEADFTIADREVRVDRMVMESENLVVDAKGPAAFDGSLDLDARLHLNERLRRDLRALVGKNLKPSDDRPGYMHIPFQVTGTVERPESDLLDKVVGERLGRDMGGLLRGLLGTPGGKKTSPAPTEGR
ncbi:MAG: AsmA-like C-terminal region-containing protein [Terrimicrobiaceae bacterium]|nr:AsmA-like C-terminal region-containing protein [Terrimicrobiaceae bacterium]